METYRAGKLPPIDDYHEFITNYHPNNKFTGNFASNCGNYRSKTISTMVITEANYRKLRASMMNQRSIR